MSSWSWLFSLNLEDVVHGKGTKGQMEKEETWLKNWWWWLWWWCKLSSGVRYKTLKDRETKCSAMAGLERS